MALRRLRPPTPGDLLAGGSVALVAIPQSLAYAELAGLPPHLGLFATALPAIVAAPLVSSRYLQTGPVALTSLLTFGALQGLAAPRSSDYIALAALLALLVGAFRVVLGLFRLGSVAYLLSDPVLIGFTTGAAVLITASQIPKVFGVEAAGDGVLADAARAIVEVGEWDGYAIVFALAATAIIVAGRKLHRLFPGVLVAVVVGTVVSSAVGYTGSRVGTLPSGFLDVSADLPWSEAGGLLVAAGAIALVGFAEPSSIARTFAIADREPWNANREMVSQGVANLAAGISGAFPVGGSFSRSSLNRLAGATSPWAGAITGAVVLLALPFVNLLRDLPRSILGVIVIIAVVKLVRLGDLAGLLGQSYPQALVGIGTFVATVAAAPRVERGVIVGVLLAMAVHLYRESTVEVTSSLDDGVLRVFPKGVVWYVTVPQIERQVQDVLADHEEVEVVVIDLGGVGRLDISGGAALQRIVSDLALAGVDVTIANIPPAARRATGIHLGGRHGVPHLEPSLPARALRSRKGNSHV